MPLPGRGFLAIWNDVAAGAESEWLRWHTREHMHERLAVPGFLAARRYCAPALATHRYFTLYPADSLATFASAPYRDRLDNPTPWTARSMPSFRNFLRGACTTLASAGSGLGGAIATLRLAGIAGGPLAEPATAMRLVREIADPAGACDAILGAHLGIADAATTMLPSRERAIRASGGEPVFEAVLMIELTRPPDYAAARAAVLGSIHAAAPAARLAFEAVYALELALARPADGP